jgi:rhodanese-related sulfurtransferase
MTRVRPRVIPYQRGASSPLVSLIGMFGRSKLPTVQARDVAADAYFLDVREDDEWAAGRIDGALHMPMMTIPQRLAELPADRDIVVVCRVGGRSAQATQFLLENGLQAINLDGGMIAWAAAARPMIATDPTAEPFVV